MIVVDSNVLAYLYLPGEYTSVAEALLEHDQIGLRRFFGEVNFETSWLGVP